MTVILYCGVTNGQRLLDRYWQYMTDDLSARIQSFGYRILIVPSEYLQSHLVQELCLAGWLLFVVMICLLGFSPLVILS
jgi:hypothetical protein